MSRKIGIVGYRGSCDLATQTSHSKRGLQLAEEQLRPGQRPQCLGLSKVLNMVLQDVRFYKLAQVYYYQVTQSATVKPGLKLIYYYAPV